MALYSTKRTPETRLSEENVTMPNIAPLRMQSEVWIQGRHPHERRRFRPVRSIAIWTLAIGVSLAMGTAARADSPPYPPVITEPSQDGALVNAADVHMETAPMDDPDQGDTHYCTDWEIWALSPQVPAWTAVCATGLKKVHIHLGDGQFVGGHAGRTELFYDTDYLLEVRHRDGEGNWSPYSQRYFHTLPQSIVLPMRIDDVSLITLPVWNADSDGGPLYLPGGETPGFLQLLTPGGELLLEIRGVDGTHNHTVNPPPLAEHVPVRVLMGGGANSLTLPASDLTFSDGVGVAHTIYLPPLNLDPSQLAVFWIATDGSSYWGDLGQSDPDFSHLAQGAAVAWRVKRPGYRVEVFAKGFQLPVNIAFVPVPGLAPDDPYFYVTELYGTIKVVTRNGTVSDYATGLLNFDPTGVFPGSGEQGVSGICVEPFTGDLFVSLLYDAAPPDGPHYPKVIRIHSNDGGISGSTITTVLDMPGELQGESHFISNLSIGPDGKLYVHMGDGFSTWTALSLDSFRGKVLRLNLNGGAPSDNPFYNSGNGISATDYIFAYGFRNPFGGVWRASDGQHYEVENGPEINDRLAVVRRGVSYGWDGTAQSMTTNAAYNWVPTHAPVNIAFVQPESFGGSGYPSDMQDKAFVTESGPTWASGPSDRGKRIVWFDLASGGNLREGPKPLIEYEGPGKATACALAAGPDGLYFSDLYKDQGYQSPIDRGANILRVRFVGTPDFDVTSRHGDTPLSVAFVDRSNVPGAYAWHWDFGDSATSESQNPYHHYTQDGTYPVRLQVTGTNGVSSIMRSGYITAGSGPCGLRGDYFDSLGFAQPLFWRVDPKIDFPWYNDPPDPTMGRETFSVRWVGKVRADYDEAYTFIVTSDDGARLWINDQLIVDAWYDQAPTEHRGTIALRATSRSTFASSTTTTPTGRSPTWSGRARVSRERSSRRVTCIPYSTIRRQRSINRRRARPHS